MSFGDSRVVEDYLKVSRRSLLKEVRELRITPEKILRYAQDDIAALRITLLRSGCHRFARYLCVQDKTHTYEPEPFDISIVSDQFNCLYICSRCYIIILSIS